MGWTLVGKQASQGSVVCQTEESGFSSVSTEVPLKGWLLHKVTRAHQGGEQLWSRDFSVDGVALAVRVGRREMSERHYRPKETYTWQLNALKLNGGLISEGNREEAILDD